MGFYIQILISNFDPNLESPFYFNPVLNPRLKTRCSFICIYHKKLRVNLLLTLTFIRLRPPNRCYIIPDIYLTDLKSLFIIVLIKITILLFLNNDADFIYKLKKAYNKKIMKISIEVNPNLELQEHKINILECSIQAKHPF